LWNWHDFGLNVVRIMRFKNNLQHNLNLRAIAR